MQNPRYVSFFSKKSASQKKKEFTSHTEREHASRQFCRFFFYGKTHPERWSCFHVGLCYFCLPGDVVSEFSSLPGFVFLRGLFLPILPWQIIIKSLFFSEYISYFFQSIWTNLSSSTVLNGLQSSWCFVGSKMFWKPFTARKFNIQTPKKTAYLKEMYFPNHHVWYRCEKHRRCFELVWGGWYVTCYLPTTFCQKPERQLKDEKCLNLMWSL